MMKLVSITYRGGEKMNAIERGITKAVAVAVAALNTVVPSQCQS